MSDKMPLNELIRAITLITDDAELSAVACAINLKLDAKRREAKSSFSVGDIVEFVAKGVLHRGQIVKINPKTIGIIAGAAKWRVSPTLLKKVS